MKWDFETRERFDLMLSKMPLFHRGIARETVMKKAQENALLRNAEMVEEEDVLNAFFSEVPTPFYSMMIRLLEQTNFDYKKYGLPTGK